MNDFVSAQVDALIDMLRGARHTPEGEGLTTSLEHSWPFPAWVTLLCLIAAAVVVLAVYLREQGGSRRRRRFGLAAVRVALVAIVLFMMYGWMRQYHRTDLPDLVIALDDSESMAVVDPDGDEADLRQRQQQTQAAGLREPTRFNLARSLLLDPSHGWLERLAEDYRVKLFLVGPSARAQPGTAAQLKDTLRTLQPDGTGSKLGQGLRDVLDAQRGRPTAAMIMFTDGVTTEGRTIGDVAEYARRKAVPLFLVGLGSDRPPRDLRLSDLLVDEVVFVDEMVNFEVKLHGDGYGGRSAKLQLKRRDRPEVLAERNVVVPQSGAVAPVRLSCRPREEGDFEYVVEVAPLEGEVNQENNRLAQRVQVRNATLRVLYVQSDPSYEFRFLKDLLSRSVRRTREGTTKAVELKTVLQEADLEHARQDATSLGVFPVRREELFAYDVLIFGDVNPSFLSRSVMQHISEFVTQRGGGVVFLAGPLYTPLAYRNTPLAELMPVDLATAAVPSAEEALKDAFVVQPTPLGLASPHMQLGAAPEENERIWQRLPGLRWLLAAPDVRSGARVLAVHPTRKGPHGDPLPVILMQFVGAGKVIFHAVDETYLWSRGPGDEQYYARYWLQTLRYLSRSKLTSAEQPAELTTDRQEYRRGDVVRVRVRFLDERQAPAADDGVMVIIQQGGGRRQQVTLRRNTTRRDLFEGAISGLPDGQYRAWLATSGERAAPRWFTIATPPGEQARIAMDSADLKRAAKTSQGTFYTIRDAQRLLADLPRGRRVTIESLPPRPLWNSPLVAVAFVSLITAEWLLRKRSGML